jgi:DNA-binding NarL/FixJ family response regulator
VAGNDIWAGPSLTQKLLKQFVGSKLGDSAASSKDVIHLFDFTDREEEVVQKVIEGASNKEVAKILGITERTVKAHMSSILRKTGTTDRISLIIKLTQQSA